MVDVRRYYTQQGEPLSQEDILATQAITAEPVEEEPIGPTTDIPFRYTEQALNPRAEAVRGREQRDPRARSVYTGMPAQARQAAGMFHDDRIPMRRMEYATGGIGQYRDLEGFTDIGNPNTLRGREQIAQLSGFEGPTGVTGVVDMMQLAQGMGISEERAQQLMNFNPNPAYRLQSAIEERGVRGLLGRKIGQDDLNALLERGAKRSELDPAFKRQITRGGGRDQVLSKRDFRQTGVMNARELGRIKDEERLFLGFSQLSGSSGRGWEIDDATGRQKNLDLKMDDPRHMAVVDRLGSNLLWGRAGAAGNLSGDDRALFYRQRNIDRRFRKAGRESGSIWENPGRIIQGVTLAAMAAMTAGALAPVAAGALGIGLASGGIAGMGAGTIGASLATGALGGAIGGGAMTGLQALTGQDVSWRSGLMNVGLGALGGGVMGGLAHGIHNIGQGAGAFQNLAGGPSSMYIPAGGGYIDVPQGMMAGGAGGIGGAGGAAGGYYQHPAAQGMALRGPGGAPMVLPDDLAQQIMQSAGMSGGISGAQVGAGAQQAGSPAPGQHPFSPREVGVAAARGGIESGVGQQMQAAQQEQMIQQSMARGRQSAAQARSTRQGIQSQYPGIFGMQLPDNPFYDPNAYTELGGVQEDIY